MSDQLFGQATAGALRLLGLKRDVPALAAGCCDYAVRVDDPNVFAPLRAWQGQVVVPVIHLADRQTQATLQVPLDRLPEGAEAFRVVDLLSDQSLTGPEGALWTRDQLGGLGLALGPYAVRVLEIRPA